MQNISNRLVIYLVGGASLFVILFGIRGLSSIINPIFLAIVITITVLPIPSRLTRRGIPGWLALVLTILMVVLLLALVIMTVFFSITKLSVTLPSYLASATQQTAEITGTETSTTGSNLSIQYGPLAQGLVTTVLNLLTQFGLALVIFFFMISAAMALPGAVRLGLDPDLPVIGRISVLTEDVRRYMSILTGINFLVGLGNTFFLFILGVEYALLWGILSWFMGYIPSIGFLIALVPPVLMAYAQYGLQTALIVLVGFVVINGGVQNFIQPKMMGKSLSISPVVVFISLFIWGFLLGGIGAILAVPLTLLVLMIMENFDGTRTIAVLMRYTGEEKKEERQKAAENVKGFWQKTKGTIFVKQPEENAGDQGKVESTGKKPDL